MIKYVDDQGNTYFYARVEEISLPKSRRAGDSPKRFVIFNDGNGGIPVKQYNRQEWHKLNNVRIGSFAKLTVINTSFFGSKRYRVDYNVKLPKGVIWNEDYTDYCRL